MNYECLQLELTMFIRKPIMDVVTLYISSELENHEFNFVQFAPEQDYNEYYGRLVDRWWEKPMKGRTN